VLPKNCDIIIRRGSWPMPPLFQIIQAKSGVPEEELYQVFNMGIGMAMMVDIGTVFVFEPSVHVRVTVTVFVLVSGLSVVTVTVLVYVLPSAPTTCVAGTDTMFAYGIVLGFLSASNVASPREAAVVMPCEVLFPLDEMTWRSATASTPMVRTTKASITSMKLNPAEPVRRLELLVTVGVCKLLRVIFNMAIRKGAKVVPPCEGP